MCVFVLASGGSVLPESCSAAKANWYWLRLPKKLRCCSSCFVSIPGVKCGCEALHACYVGALLLSLLFQGSTAFTEQISVEKYPTYKEYQKKVNRLLPALRPPSFLSAENAATRIQTAWKKKKANASMMTSRASWKLKKKGFLSFGKKSSITPTKKSE